MVNLIRAQGGKMLKRTCPNDANIKTVSLTCAENGEIGKMAKLGNGKTRRGVGNSEMLNPTGPDIATGSNMANR